MTLARYYPLDMYHKVPPPPSSNWPVWGFCDRSCSEAGYTRSRGERLRGVSRSREERRPHVTLGVELYHRRPHGRCWDELIFEMHDEPRKRRDACTALSTRGI